MRDSDGAVRYYPVLQYYTADGSAVTVQSKRTLPKYEGKKLTIYYMADEPRLFSSKAFSHTSSLQVLFSAYCLPVAAYRNLPHNQKF